MELKEVQNKILTNGITYDEYKKQYKYEVGNLLVETKVENEKKNYALKKLNFSRSSRIEKQYVPSAELIEATNKINKPQLWMVLTETWCGDSAQNLPVLVKISELNTNITLRILFRDLNPEIMDLYLTNGTRSIPKLIAFNEEGKELFRWGARPATAQQLIIKLKEKGSQKNEWMIELHKWYANNRGKEVEREMLQLLNSL